MSKNLRSLAPTVKATEKRVETANSLPATTFFKNFLPDESLQKINEQVQTRMPGCSILVDDAKGIKNSHLNACLRLVEETSASDYRHSEIKWSASKKRKEMMLPDMKYVLLLEPTNPASLLSERNLAGFISFMITYEDGREVIYVYEVHFLPQWRGKGFGGLMMEMVDLIGLHVGVFMAMLTVFKCNQRAVDWYHSLGYIVDEYSPGPKRLRSGAVKEPSYVILSKALLR